ncbi:MAG TPA: heavy-metal-associated domain-containing protein [Ktedonobacterales bacterium]|nr:heavy-metal-associated domain-containing protein [Ktedonobacterales bacterium]
MAEFTVKAPDISCEHCQHTIEGDLSKMQGISQVKVDIPQQTVLVHYDPQMITRDQIVAELDEIGYPIAQ